MDPKALYKISYGMYVVSSKMDGKFNGQIANSLFQATADPPRIAVCINKKNLTHEFIQKSRVFVASVLSEETPMTFIGRFGFRSGRDIDKFEGVRTKIGQTGVPIVLDHALAYIEAKVIGSMDAGTHTLFLGEVVNAETLDNNQVPMTYAYYHQVKRGKAPKTAPTYIKESVPKENAGSAPGNMVKYVCAVCGYIYDPKAGDPDSGIKPGTSFADLPDDWVCPVCGASKAEFEKVSD